MEVELVCDERQFRDLKGAWRNLQALGAVKNITMTWDWMVTWWEIFKGGRSLAILVVKDGGEVIGIAPFIRRKIRYFRLIPCIRMEFMASGEDEKDEICSDYLDFIIRSGREKEVLEAIFEYMCYPGELAWNELLLPRMDAESSHIPLLFDLAKTYRLDIEELERVICPYINLPATFEEYLSQLGRSTRYQIRWGMRKLNEAGNVVFRIAETKEEVETYIEILIRLHQSRWTQKGEPGAFSSDKFRLFHNKMASIAFERDLLRLGVLFLNGKPLACLYNFQFKDKVCFYQLGMEVSDLRYGMLAHAYAIGHAISEGAREYDLLAGASDHKRRLAKKQHEIVALRMSKPYLRESLYKTMYRLQEQVKTVRNYSQKRLREKG